SFFKIAPLAYFCSFGQQLPAIGKLSVFRIKHPDIGLVRKPGLKPYTLMRFSAIQLKRIDMRCQVSRISAAPKEVNQIDYFGFFTILGKKAVPGGRSFLLLTP